MIRGRSPAIRSLRCVHGAGGYRAARVVTGRAVRCASRCPRACSGSGRAAGTRRPCQNSTSSGTSRYPPQCGGRGTSPSANRLRASSTVARASRGRPAARLWSLAHAPSCASRGRVAKYASDRPSSSGSILARTVICRSSSRQKTVNAARGFSDRSRPFRLSRFVKNDEAVGRRSRGGARGARWARRRRRRSRARSRSQAARLRSRLRRATAGTARSGRGRGRRDRRAGCSWIGRRALRHLGIVTGHEPACSPGVPPAGLEPALPAPEAGALSTELRGRAGGV